MDIGGERNVSDIHLEVQWSDPLLGLLFLYHCREEKLGGSSQALCSTSPAGQDNLAAVLTSPQKTHNRTLNFHIVARKDGHNFPSFTLPHTFPPHTIRES